MRVQSAAAAAVGLMATGAAAQVECVDGLYMIVARGTGEDPGLGATGNLTKAIAAQIANSKQVPVDYPATFNDPIYTESQTEGVEEMQKLVEEYAEACPDNKMAVFGYSQGGQVVSDVVCGGGFSDNEPVDDDIVKRNIVAMIIFGDPSFQANETFSEGTSINDGIFERPDVSECEGYKNLRSFCDTGDVYCDSGDDSDVHGEYLQRYGEEVKEFVIGAFINNKYTEATGGSDSSSTMTRATHSTATHTRTMTMTSGGGHHSTMSTNGTTTATDTMTETATETASETATVTESETGPATQSGGSGDDGSAAVAVGVKALGLLPVLAAGAWMVL